MAGIPWSIGLAFAVTSAVITVILTWLLILLSHRKNWLDYPDDRKRHPTPVSPLGGVAIFIVFWAAVAIGIHTRPAYFAMFSPEALIIFAGAVPIFILGLYDDFHPVGAGGKLLMQIAVGIWLWYSGLGIERIWVPTVGGVNLGPASLPVTLIWFILLVNAVNIIDGIDALAGGVCLIGLASVVIIGIRSAVPDAIMLAVILAGALAGFLVFNRPPARIFLGDCGALTLGYFFAVLALWLPVKRYTVVAVYVPLLAVLVPLAESTWSILRRTARRRKPTAADRGHLHYRLIDHGMSEGGVRLLFYGLSGIGVAFSLAAAYGNRRFWLVVFGFFVLSLIFALYIWMRTPRRR
jgi:UDP-GlcNAc:undecaprenyl-phosphate GlcNAc-1-phosphate transferase